MTKPKPLTPDAMLGRTPAFVKRLAARFEKAKARSQRRHKSPAYTLAVVKELSALGVKLTERIRSRELGASHTLPRIALKPRLARGKWTVKDEQWWGKSVKTEFLKDLPNAIWHMPDAAAARMQWLERKARLKS